MKKLVIIFVMVLGLLLCSCYETDTGSKAEAPTESESEYVVKTESERAHIVKFDSQGGSKVESQSVKHGEKIKKPENPTKACWRGCWCSIDGWYVGDEKWSFSGNIVTEDIVLTAKWYKCFGITEKMADSLKKAIRSWYDVEYTWDDVVELQCLGYCDRAGKPTSATDADTVRYQMVFSDGKVSPTYGFGLSYFDEFGYPKEVG